MSITSAVIIVLVSVAIMQFCQCLSRSDFIDAKTGIKYSSRMTETDIANLKRGQEKMTRMLREFDRVCRKYGLSYWCMGGTLIGTLRHAGWVPWDGDLDVAMIDSDYEVLFSVAPFELPKDMWLKDKRNDKHHSREHAQIRDLNSCYDKYIKMPRKSHGGLCLDIFLYKKKYDRLIAYPNVHISPHDRSYHYNFIFPLKEMKFEDISVYIPNNYEQYSINSWKSYPPPLPHLYMRMPHEGRIIPDKACPWHKTEYPNLS